MKITDGMVNAADSVLSRVRPGINDGQIRLALEAAFAVRAKYTREQINEMIGLGEMFVDTNPEADWIAASEMACPHCGGSGHKDDVRPLSASPAGVGKPLEIVPTDRLERLIGTGDPTSAEAHDMAVEILNHRQAARIMRAIEPAGVGVETVSPQTHLAVTDDMVRAAIFRLHGDDFYDYFDERSEFALEKVTEVRSALDAAFSAFSTDPSHQPKVAPIGWVTVRVEDTCDGLLINADDMKRFGLREDVQYQGHFLPDGRYRIVIPASLKGDEQ